MQRYHTSNADPCFEDAWQLVESDCDLGKDGKREDWVLAPAALDLAHNSLDQSGNAQDNHEHEHNLSWLVNVVVKVADAQKPDSTADSTAVFKSIASLVVCRVSGCT